MQKGLIVKFLPSLRDWFFNAVKGAIAFKNFPDAVRAYPFSIDRFCCIDQCGDAIFINGNLDRPPARIRAGWFWRQLIGPLAYAPPR